MSEAVDSILVTKDEWLFWNIVGRHQAGKNVRGVSQIQLFDCYLGGLNAPWSSGSGGAWVNHKNHLKIVDRSRSGRTQETDEC